MLNCQIVGKTNTHDQTQAHDIRSKQKSAARALESLFLAGGGPSKTSFVSELSKIQQVTQHPVSDVFYTFFF